MPDSRNAYFAKISAPGSNPNGYVTPTDFPNAITLSRGSSRSMPIKANSGLFLCFSQISFSIKGISLRHTPHQLAVNCNITTLPRNSESFICFPSVGVMVKSGAGSPTFTIYPVLSAATLSVFTTTLSATTAALSAFPCPEHAAIPQRSNDRPPA